MDLLELLAQQHLALPLIEGLAGLLLQLVLQPEHLDAVAELLGDTVEPRRELDGLEHLLLLGRLDIEEAGDGVGKNSRRFDRAHRGTELRRRLWQQLECLRGQPLQVERPRLDLDRDAQGLGQRFHARSKERVARLEVDHAEALLALGDHVAAAVGRSHVAQDAGQRAHPVQPILGRRVLGRILLQQEAHLAAAANGLFDGRDGALAADRHGQHDAWKNDEVTNRQEDQHVLRQGLCSHTRGHWFSHDSPSRHQAVTAMEDGADGRACKPAIAGGAGRLRCGGSRGSSTVARRIAPS